MSSVSSSSTERPYEDNQRFMLSPVRLTNPDATSTLPSRIHTHFDVVSDVPSCPTPPLSHGGSPDRTFHDLSESHDPEQGPSKPNIMVTFPAGVPQGLRISLAGGSGVSSPTAFVSPKDVYRTSIEDWKRTFGLNIVPRRPSKILLQLMWVALKDKVLVR